MKKAREEWDQKLLRRLFPSLLEDLQAPSSVTVSRVPLFPPQPDLSEDDKFCGAAPEESEEKVTEAMKTAGATPQRACEAHGAAAKAPERAATMAMVDDNGAKGDEGVTEGQNAPAAAATQAGKTRGRMLRRPPRAPGGYGGVFHATALAHGFLKRARLQANESGKRAYTHL